MDLTLSNEQKQLVDSFSALYTKESSPARVREAEHTGFDQKLWEALAETGAVAMGVDQAAGGWGASLLDLALVAEVHGRHLGSVPLCEAMVAARLLAVTSGVDESEMTKVLSGKRIVTFAPLMVMDAEARFVPGAACAAGAVILVGSQLLLIPIDDECKNRVRDVASSSAADLILSAKIRSLQAVELARGQEAVELHRRGVDEWMVLTASALGGLGRRALELTVGYAREREAFGAPIGTYQAVAHRLADVATHLDGAELLAREAAWAASEAPNRHRMLAAMAFPFATETARTATYWGVHFHGGYGFMLETDIQLYFRRARGWPGVMAEPTEVYRWVIEAGSE